MRSSVFLLLAFLLLAGAVPPSAHGQYQSTGQNQDLQLTPAQQRMIDNLPPAQRAEVLRQMGQASQRQTARAPQDQTQPDQQTDDEVETDGQEPETPADVIQPNDTLVIEVTFRYSRDELDAAERLAQESHPLMGRHVVETDRFGRLSMPGIHNVALAGLRAEQAQLRLMAEPALRDMAVYVTRLTLEKVGREALEPFGMRIFRQQDADRSQRMRSNLPVPADYVVGPGDTVQLFLFGKNQGRHDILITSDGTLQVPELGPVSVAGMRFTAMKDLVERRVREETIGMQASVSMGELRSIEVFVIGEVRRPDLHQISALSTVVGALYQARGITEIGSLRSIKVIRGGESLGTFDAYELLLDGNTRGDLRLESGDVIFVPSTGPRAGVIGEARRPAWYELTARTTVGQLLDFAGGAGPEGNLRLAQIERTGSDGSTFIDVDATTAAGRNTPVEAGDVVRIPRAPREVHSGIALRGHFATPGIRAWREGMRLSDVLYAPEVFDRNPDLDYALVVRQRDDGRGATVHAFSPRRLFADPDSNENIILESRDQVLAFGYDDLLNRRALVDELIERLRRQATSAAPAPIAHVAGAVRAPGAYPLSRGMRLNDLVRAGGGLAESAFEGSVEVTRYRVVEGMQREIDHLEVDLRELVEGNTAANLLVQEHDVMTVKQMPLWAERGTIELRGEVRFPGFYPIRPGETLAQVVDRAGGLTEFAYPQASVFTRETLREREQEQIDNMVRRLEADIASAASQGGPTGAQAQAMASSLVEQLKETEAVGRLVIDLPQVLGAAGDADTDVLVHGGDVLVVPPRPQEVTILGEVYFPTSHIYEPGIRGREYLQRSGGMTPRADGRRIYVVRANGAVESGGRRGRIDIRPGDTIVVPLDAERLPTMVRVMNISQILYQLAITAAALQTIGAL